MDCSTGDWACELSRIADALSGFDSNSFAATLLATLIGAGVAAGVSFWLAERDRPRPIWKADTKLESSNSTDGVHSVEVEVTNIGDGVAYHPRMIVQGATVTGRRREEKSILQPGEFFRTWIGVPGTGELGADPETLQVVDGRAVTWPPGVIVELEWHQPPRRTRTKRAKLNLASPLA